jgi:prepilin-type N-terminal cleavage/methylation domain-containing protein
MSLRVFRNQCGFTLTELLVACAMIGVVMAGLFSIFQTGQQSYLTGTNQIEAQQSLRLALLRVTNEIREAGYCPTCGTGSPTIAAFSAVTSTSSTGFTIQNDWNGNWDGASGISTGIVTQVVMASNGTTSNVTRGEQIVYAYSGGNLTRREMGVDATAVTVVSNLASLSFTYLDVTGTAFTPTSATEANIRTIVVNAVGQPQVQPTAYTAGRVQVAMTDSVRLRNRVQ